jgi:ABC-type spermidine/putrescine transport system permease subunit II
MRQHVNEGIRRETFINIRKLAALDIVFHGTRFILVEFLVAVVVPGVIAALGFFAFFRNPAHSITQLFLGCIMLWIAMNYITLLLYTVSIIRGKSAEREVAFELEHKDYYARKYSRQSLLLVLPLIVPVLAVIQEIQRRSRK